MCNWPWCFSALQEEAVKKEVSVLAGVRDRIMVLVPLTVRRIIMLR
jgi:hypothetical protein